MFREEKIASYTTKERRIQLLKLTEELEVPTANIRYQIRINRKIVETYTFESQAAKKMASIITSELLQQKFTF